MGNFRSKPIPSPVVTTNVVPLEPPKSPETLESLALIDFADESIEILNYGERTDSYLKNKQYSIIITKSGRQYESDSDLHLKAKEKLGDSYRYPLFFYNECEVHDDWIKLVVWKNKDRFGEEKTIFSLDYDQQIVELKPFAVEGYYILTYDSFDNEDSDSDSDDNGSDCDDSDRYRDIAVTEHIANVILKKQKASNIVINSKSPHPSETQ